MLLNGLLFSAPQSSNPLLHFHPVSDAKLGLDNLGIRRVALYFPADVGHVDPEYLALIVIRPPNVVEYLFVSQHPACVLR